MRASLLLLLVLVFHASVAAPVEQALAARDAGAGKAPAAEKAPATGGEEKAPDAGKGPAAEKPPTTEKASAAGKTPAGDAAAGKTPAGDAAAGKTPAGDAAAEKALAGEAGEQQSGDAAKSEGSVKGTVASVDTAANETAPAATNTTTNKTTEGKAVVSAKELRENPAFNITKLFPTHAPPDQTKSKDKEEAVALKEDQAVVVNDTDTKSKDHQTGKDGKKKGQKKPEDEKTKEDTSSNKLVNFDVSTKEKENPPAAAIEGNTAVKTAEENKDQATKTNGAAEKHGAEEHGTEEHGAKEHGAEEHGAAAAGPAGDSGILVDLEN